MDESTKLNHCADCPCHCKPIFAIFLIVLGVTMLRSEIQTGSAKRDSKGTSDGKSKSPSKFCCAS